jgi:hypothetical protein
MTSFRQIEANRRNALRSTGPKTEDGKRQSRRNAHLDGRPRIAVSDLEAFSASLVEENIQGAPVPLRSADIPIEDLDAADHGGSRRS